MSVTVRGTFAVVDQASRPIKAIRDAAFEADKAVAGLGGQLDKLGTQKQLGMLSALREKIQNIGGASRDAAPEAEGLAKAVNDIPTNAVTKVGLEGVTEAKDELRLYTQALKDVPDRVTTRVDIDTTAAEGKIARLRLALASLPRNVNIGAGGGGGGLGAAAASAASGGGGGGFGAIPWMPAAIGIGGPPLVAGLGPLIGSLGAGILGAGALGAAGVGALGVGGGSIMAVWKGVSDDLKKVGAAYANVVKAQQTYGAESKQAATAQIRLNGLVKDSGPLVLEVVKMVHQLGQEWQDISKPAQQALFGIMLKGLTTVKTLMPVVAGIARQGGDALGHALGPIFGAMRGGMFQDLLKALGDTFAKMSWPMMNAFFNLFVSFLRIAVAASPYLVKMAESFERWTVGIRSMTANTPQLSRVVGGLIGQFQTWWDVLREMGKVIVDFFAAGATQGKSFTESFTGLFHEWDVWIKSTEGQQGLHEFFSNGIEALKSFAAVLGPVVVLLGEFITHQMPLLTDLFNNLGPVLKPLEMLVRLIDLILGGVNELIRRWPVLGGAISTALGLLATYFAVTKLAAMDGMIGKLGKLAAAWLGVGAASQAAASGAVGGAAAAGARGLSTGEIALAGGGGVLLRGGSNLSSTEAANATANAAEAGGGMGGLRGLALTGAAGLTALRSKLPSLLKTASRFAAPLILLQSGMELLEGGNPLTSSDLGGSMLKGGAVGFAVGGPTGAAIGAGLAGAGHILSPAPTGLDLHNVNTDATQRQIAGGQLYRAQKSLVGLEIASSEMSPGDKKKMADYIAHTRAYLGERISKQAQETGAQFAKENAEAFTLYDKRYGLHRAMSLTISDVMWEMKGMGPTGSKVLAENMLTWSREQAKQNPKLWGQVHDLERHIIGSFQAMGIKAAIVNGEIFTGSSEKWAEIGKAIEGPMAKAEYMVKGAFSNIYRQAVGQLESFGYSAAAAKELVTAASRGQIKPGEVSPNSRVSNPELANTNAQVKPHKGHARGGRLAGEGLADNVPLFMGMAAPGELIVNRHTEARVDKALARYGTSLGREVAGENTPHSAAFATGGVLGNVQQGVRSVAEAMMHQFPQLAVTSTRSGTHASHSLHYLGEAVDLASDPTSMNAAGTWVGRNYGKSLEEGIHNPTLSYKHGREVAPGFWGPATWAGHANHIHIGVLGGGGVIPGVAAGSPSLGEGAVAHHVNLGRKSPHGGIPNAFAAAGWNSIASAMESKINGKIGGAGPGGGFVGGHGGGGSTAQNEALGRAMMIQFGYPASEWPFLQKLWTQESGWNAYAMNRPGDYSAAYGIPQSLGHGRPYALGDARAQIAWGLNYIRGRADERTPKGAWAHEVAYNWYGRGGRVPDWGGWNGAGGSGTFDRAAVVGVGDGHVPEDVKITPHVTRAGGGRGTGHVALNFHPGSIVVHGTDHAAAEKFVDHVMGRLADAIDGMGLESEHEVAL